MNELVCGSVGTGKTTYIRDVVKSRVNQNMNSMVLSNKVCKNLYWKDHSGLTLPVCESDICLTNENNTPNTFATYIVNRYLSRAGHSDDMCLVVDDFNFDCVNPDYKIEAYYNAITEICKVYKINTVFTYRCDEDKHNVSFEDVPKRLLKAADKITILK